MGFSNCKWRVCSSHPNGGTPIESPILRRWSVAGLPVIYHGCGNVKRVLQDFIETGIDAYNPLEDKAGFDVVGLRRQYGHRLGFCGNMDVIEWARCDEQQLRAIVIRNLKAVIGGGRLFHSDHSVPSHMPGRNFDYIVNLVKQFGQYPLQLGEFDISELSLAD